MRSPGGLVAATTPHCSKPPSSGALLAAAVYLLRGGVLDYEARIGLRPIEMVVAVAASLGGHLLVFLVAAGLILIPRMLAGRRGSPWLEFLAALAGASIVVAIVIRRVLLTALILDDMRAAAHRRGSWNVGGSVCRRHHRPRRQSRPAIAVPRSASASRDPFSWRVVTLCVAVIVVCVAILPRLLMLADWGTSLQKVVVCIAWSASIALMMQIRAARTRRLPLAVVGVAMVLGVTATSVAARQPSAEQPTGVNRALEMDPGDRTVLDHRHVAGRRARSRPADDHRYGVLRRASPLRRCHRRPHAARGAAPRRQGIRATSGTSSEHFHDRHRQPAARLSVRVQPRRGVHARDRRLRG